MFSEVLKGGLSRRLFLKSSAVAAASASIPRIALGADEPIKIGFLAPLTGAAAAWGKPGLDGCQIWAERINAAGGIKLADGNHPVEFIAYDEEYDPAKARTGATKLIREDDVKFIMMLGGDPWPGVEPVAERTGMLFSTLLPSDLSPDTTTLVAPCEVHPAYLVTGVDWLARNRPELKTAVICAQDDSLGLPSIATYLAAFEAAGIEQLRDPLLFDPSTTDFAPIVTRLMSGNPDIICLDTSYSDFVHPICQQLYQQGYTGQIISATLDFYDQIVEKTSKEFMEGVIFQFPDFDDPKMNSDIVNFHDANGFYEEYSKRFPNQWGAVSWEYAAIMDLWKDAAEKTGSAEPEDVLKAMLDEGKGKHAFGAAVWWGEELFGVSHALVGNWPVVMIQDGKAVIQEFGSIPDWYDKHGDLLIQHMKDYRQMWDQRS